MLKTVQLLESQDTAVIDLCTKAWSLLMNFWNDGYLQDTYSALQKLVPILLTLYKRYPELKATCCASAFALYRIETLLEAFLKKKDRSAASYPHSRPVLLTLFQLLGVFDGAGSNYLSIDLLLETARLLPDHIVRAIYVLLVVRKYPEHLISEDQAIKIHEILFAVGGQDIQKYENALLLYRISCLGFSRRFSLLLLYSMAIFAIVASDPYCTQQTREVLGSLEDRASLSFPDWQLLVAIIEQPEKDLFFIQNRFIYCQRYSPDRLYHRLGSEYLFYHLMGSK
jgi:hypothetical protein